MFTDQKIFTVNTPKSLHNDRVYASPHLHPLGVTPFELCRDLWHQKTRVHGLSSPCNVVCIILSLAVPVELVTDRQTGCDVIAYPLSGDVIAYPLVLIYRKKVCSVERFQQTDRQTDRHTTTAYTALAWRRAVKILTDTRTSVRCITSAATKINDSVNAISITFVHQLTAHGVQATFCKRIRIVAILFKPEAISFLEIQKLSG